MVMLLLFGGNVVLFVMFCMEELSVLLLFGFMSFLSFLFDLLISKLLLSISFIFLEVSFFSEVGNCWWMLIFVLFLELDMMLLVFILF